MRKNLKQQRVFVLGNDNIGWSISNDRRHLLHALSHLNVKISNNPFIADIIYCVWWNLLDNWKYGFFRKKAFIATVTNDLSQQRETFNRVKKNVDIWVCANKKQVQELLNWGIQEENIKYSPFYVDEMIFKRLNLTRLEISKSLGINHNLIEDRILIGSFQRDSLGADLSKPKWQKNPDLLVSILKTLKPEKYLLVLAGPRRHYIIKQCEKFDIPYLFIGSLSQVKAGVDDINVNTLPLEKINLLYNMVDIYLVTSKSEGGPKAVIEAALTQTPILTTKVGMAPDLLDVFSLYKTREEAVEKIKILIENNEIRNKFIKLNFESIIRVNNFSAYVSRIKDIIESVI